MVQQYCDNSNSIMGNIEVMSPTERKPIFTKTNIENRHTSKSPRKTSFKAQEIEHTQRDNRVYHARNQLNLQQTNRLNRIHDHHHAVSRSGRIVRNQQQQIESVHHNNLKTNAGNRVSNFNDFMIQLKRQLNNNSTEGQQNMAELQQTLRNGAQNREILRHNSSRQLVMNLKLQNQRLQLDKYKRLVERELSKNHSIEDISLRNKSENEQVLTIRYDEFKEKDFKKKNQGIGEDRLTKFKEDNSQQLVQKIAQEKRLYEFSYERAKEVFAELSKRTNDLGLLIHRAEMPFKQSMSFHPINHSPISTHQLGTITKNVKLEHSPSYRGRYEEVHPSQERISKISGLFEEINYIHSNQEALQQKIKAAIKVNDDSESDYSVTFQSHSQARQRC